MHDKAPQEEKMSALPLLIGVMLALALSYFVLQRFMADEVPYTAAVHNDIQNPAYPDPLGAPTSPAQPEVFRPRNAGTAPFTLVPPQGASIALDSDARLSGASISFQSIGECKAVGEFLYGPSGVNCVQKSDTTAADTTNPTDYAMWSLGKQAPDGTFAFIRHFPNAEECRRREAMLRRETGDTSMDCYKMARHTQ